MGKGFFFFRQEKEKGSVENEGSFLEFEKKSKKKKKNGEKRKKKFLEGKRKGKKKKDV